MKYFLLDPIKIISKKPLILIPFLIFYLLPILYNPIALKIAPKLLTNAQNISYLAAYLVVFLLISSYIFSLSVSLISSSINKKKINPIRAANRLFLKIFLLSFFFLVIFNLVQLVSFSLAFSIGKLLALSTQLATVFAFILLFLGLLFFFAPLSLAPFILVSKKESLKSSIKSSLSLFLSKFPTLISLIVSLIVIQSLLERYLAPISLNLSNFVEIVLITPYFVILLTLLSLEK